MKWPILAKQENCLSRRCVCVLRNSQRKASLCFIETLLDFTKPSYFITVIYLFLFLVCLLQVLRRRHPQYRHRQVCPLHRGSYVSNDYSFLKSQAKRMKLLLCEGIFYYVEPSSSRARWN